MDNASTPRDLQHRSVLTMKVDKTVCPFDQKYLVAIRPNRMILVEPCAEITIGGRKAENVGLVEVLKAMFMTGF